METTYAYLISLYDDGEPSGIFTTETQAHAAAEKFLAVYWEQKEREIKTADYFSEDEKRESLTELRKEKEFWKEEGYVDDLIYIREVPMGKLITYDGDFEG